VAGGDNAITSREAAMEIVSVHLFSRAYDGDIVATRRWIDDQLARLRNHPDGCLCREPCALAAKVSANKVHWTVQSWQRQYRRSKVSARR
jgi:hypothetical protein